MLLQYYKLLRIPQWVKNFFLFTPLLFSQHLFDKDYFSVTLGAFFIFCFVSSVVYTFNDIIDAPADRTHPKKKSRPLASGKLSVNQAIIIIIILLSVIGLFLPTFNINFIYAVGGYFVLNIFYSFWFKHIVLLDVFSIAAGFMIRIAAGAYAINVEISSWLVLTTMFISLFLGVMKRFSELQLISETDSGQSRKVLVYYSLSFTEQMATVAAAGVIICYALYTVSSRTVAVFGTENLIFTTPFVVYGIFRYMYLVYMDKKGENTSEEIFRDISMIINIILYITVTVLIIYHLL